jgi:hypothetical protein
VGRLRFLAMEEPGGGFDEQDWEAQAVQGLPQLHADGAAPQDPHPTVQRRQVLEEAFVGEGLGFGEARNGGQPGASAGRQEDPAGPEGAGADAHEVGGQEAAAFPQQDLHASLFEARGLVVHRHLGDRGLDRLAGGVQVGPPAPGRGPQGLGHPLGHRDEGFGGDAAVVQAVPPQG